MLTDNEIAKERLYKQSFFVGYSLVLKVSGSLLWSKKGPCWMENVSWIEIREDKLEVVLKFSLPNNLIICAQHFSWMASGIF